MSTRHLDPVTGFTAVVQHTNVNASDAMGYACEDGVYATVVSPLDAIVSNGNLSPEVRLHKLVESAQGVTDFRIRVDLVCEIAILFTNSSRVYLTLYMHRSNLTGGEGSRSSRFPTKY
jgi:hypothetical protein